VVDVTQGVPVALSVPININVRAARPAGATVTTAAGVFLQTCLQTMRREEASVFVCFLLSQPLVLLLSQPLVLLRLVVLITIILP
jgi:hypothetical protein